MGVKFLDGFGDFRRGERGVELMKKFGGLRRVAGLPVFVVKVNKVFTDKPVGGGREIKGSVEGF